ncbi:Homeobox-leucine zipper protein HOX1 [Dichanthelium oligosanthes]|uniref:Homeobox-leucine zipper protein HOX1 n=1 Tax=Dichanthelium oligosanthes TaxID=888268 RepID=A0A1E5VTL3_9POAL|nr:Homeobox-leucine zipper protein HOX1 [Dichanthelium oligosanthes]
MEMTVNARDQEQHGLGLGLSLSLSIATAAPVEPSPPPPPQQQQQQRAISVAPISSHPAPPMMPQPQWWNGAAGLFFSPSSGMDRSVDRKQQQQLAAVAACHIHEMPFLRGIDVNRAPAGVIQRGSCSEDEEPAASSPNSTLSSLSGKRAAATRSGDHTPRAGGGGGSDDEDSGAGGGSRKKLRLSKDQAAVLEESFKEHNTLNPKQKAALAKQLNLKPRQVEVWFQNRRARTKLKQTEVDCEFLKRCCETLTEENRRLQREVAELRALKLVAPHQYARMPPPTTLTMCPSCERLASADEAGRAARPVPTGPWGPVPVRPVFVDGPARRP